MKLNSKQRKSLPDSDFGLITDSGERKYPMHDKQHVILAIRMFKHCPKGKEKELAAKINQKIKEFGIKVNPATTGAFTKYAASEAFSLSKEASNVGVLEPIVGGSETLHPMGDVEIDSLNAPTGMKELMKLINEKPEPTEESFVNPRAARITMFQGDMKNRPFDQISIFKNFDQRINDIIVLGEYNDALKYTLDQGTVYGVDSWLYKDQIVDIYNNEYDDDLKVTELTFLISTTDGDERKYLLAVLYRLDCTNGCDLLTKVIKQLNEYKDKPFSSYFSPNTNITFGPFDLEDRKFDYPSEYNFDGFADTSVNSRWAMENLLEKLIEHNRIEPSNLNHHTCRMMCAELLNQNYITGYKCYESDVFEESPTYMVVQKNSNYGIATFESPYVVIFWYTKEDFFNCMTVATRYADRWYSIDPVNRAVPEYINIKKDYDTVSFEDDMKDAPTLNDMLINSIEDVFKFGIDAYNNNRLFDMKDAAATLFTTSRFIECDDDVNRSVVSNCGFKCRNLIKKIYTMESGFDFLKFYKDSGYDFYTDGQKVMESKLAYNTIMGI